MRWDYAYVLGETRLKANPEETGSEIKMVRKIQLGDMLLELGQSAKDKLGFNSKLKQILG